MINQRFLNTEGIIIKRTNYKDADKILTIFTKDAGKVTGLAKGIRKINSRRKGHLELLCHTKVHLIQSHEWYIIAQTETISTNPGIRDDMQKINLAYYISEVFDKLIPEGEKNENMFEFIKKTLTILNKAPDINFINAFNLKLLKLSGFYSSLRIEDLSDEIRKYFRNLEVMKYEDVVKINISKELTKTSHKILKNYTEEILEKSLKTKLFV